MSDRPARPAWWSETSRDIASPELLTALAALATSRRLVDGELLYARGDAGADIIGVHSGLIRVVAVTAEGYEGLLGLYRAGTWFGEVSFFDGLPRPTDAYAVGDTEVLVVPAAQLHALLERHPRWYRDFARVLSHKLRSALAHIESSFLAPSVRIALRLLDLAEGYGKPAAAGILIDLVLPQEDLARMLGLTRQSVNKELRAFQAHGWLEIRRGRITVTQPAALRAHVADNGGAALLGAVSAA